MNFVTFRMDMIGVGITTIARLTTKSRVVCPHMKFATQWKWYADYARSSTKNWQPYNGTVLDLDLICSVKPMQM